MSAGGRRTRAAELIKTRIVAVCVLCFAKALPARWSFAYATFAEVVVAVILRTDSAGRAGRALQQRVLLRIALGSWKDPSTGILAVCKCRHICWRACRQATATIRRFRIGDEIIFPRLVLARNLRVLCHPVLRTELDLGEAFALVGRARASAATSIGERLRILFRGLYDFVAYLDLHGELGFAAPLVGSGKANSIHWLLLVVAACSQSHAHHTYREQ